MTGGTVCGITGGLGWNQLKKKKNNIAEVHLNSEQ